jgi:hypothetical protein
MNGFGERLEHVEGYRYSIDFPRWNGIGTGLRFTFLLSGAYHDYYDTPLKFN